MKISHYFILILLFSYLFSSGQTGFIDLSSSPNGAEIYIDKNYVGVTPKVLEVTVGKCSILLKYEGYESKRKVVEVVEGLVLRKVIKLNAYGKLSIVSIPSGSSVFIDGIEIRQKTPISNYYLSPGRHSIQASNYAIKGFEKEGLDFTKNIYIKQLQSQKLHFNFFNKLGSINVKSNPNAKLYLDGNYIGKSPFKIKYLERGKYDLLLKANLSERYAEEFEISKNVEVSPKKTISVNANFYKEYKFGILSLNSNKNYEFQISRVKSKYNQAFNTNKKNYSINNLKLVTGEYELKWMDPERNQLTFTINENQSTSIFAPVKKEYLPKYKLSDLPSYIGRHDYISKHSYNLPESKTVSVLGYGFDKDVPSLLLLGQVLAWGGLGVAILGALNDDGPMKGIGIISCVSGSFIAPIQFVKKEKRHQVNIDKNRRQREALNKDYDKLRMKMKKELEVKNIPVKEKNIEIEKSNNNLPPVEIKYKTK